METKKQGQHTLTDERFKPVPKEKGFDHTMVVSPKKKTRKNVTPSLYNPHNYRLYFSFTKEKYHPKQGMVRAWSAKFKNHGKEFTALGHDVRVTIKKTMAEVIPKNSDQQWYMVDRPKAREEILAILNKIEATAIVNFKKFISCFGGKTDYVILKREGRPDLSLFTTSDNKIKNEPFVDSLDPKMTFETEIVSKRYKKKEVEYKQPVYAARYLENSALKEFSPEIAMRLAEIAQVSEISNKLLNNLAETNAYIAKNYESHVKMVEKGSKVMELLEKRLSQKKLKEFF